MLLLNPDPLTRSVQLFILLAVAALLGLMVLSRRRNVRSCRVCGCTERRACVTAGVPCWWVEADLCSTCRVRLVVPGGGF